MSHRRSVLAATALVAAAAVSLSAPALASDKGHGNDHPSRGQESGHDSGNGKDHGNGNSQEPEHGTYTIGLWGDQPYDDKNPGYRSTIIDTLINSDNGLNSQPLEFTVFDGDIKGGKEHCDAAIYDAALTMFNAVKWPTVYTPGDNEWTDCDRSNNGPNPATGLNYEPNVQLAKIRDMFFSGSTSLGQTTMRVAQENQKFPENARWEHDGVTYLTLNIPGSDNNYPVTDDQGRPLDADGNLVADTGLPADGDLAEYTARNNANRVWLEQGFRAAREEHSKAIMIVIQADMWSEADGVFNGNTDNTTHYADTKSALARLVLANPDLRVVLVNGDTHAFVQDNPLQITDPSHDYANFSRVTTDGSKVHGWTKVDVDPSTGEVFTFTPMHTA